MHIHVHNGEEIEININQNVLDVSFLTYKNQQKRKQFLCRYL